MTKATPPATAKQSVVKLGHPIKRGDSNIEQITLLKPNAGALRGANLMSLLQMDVNALITVLPRVSEPTLTEQEVLALDTDDLFALGSEVAAFLLPSNLKNQFMSE